MREGLRGRWAYKAAAEHGVIIVAPDTSPRGEGVADDAAYDLGQGAGFYVDATQAPWAPHFRMESYVTGELIDLIDGAFPTTKTRSIFGHSMGGLFALLLSTEEMVSHVVTLAAPIYVAEEQGLKFLPPREACTDQFVPKARRHLKGVPPAANKTYRKMPLIGIHELVDVIEATKGCIPKVTAPVLIMHSRDDHTADPRSADYIYAHVSSRVRSVYWLEQSGHLLPLAADREQVFEQSAAFLLSPVGADEQAN